MLGRRPEVPLPPLDASAVLEKVLTLPLSVWRYHSEPPGISHLGPMAQDFRQAFGLGTRDDRICVVDAVGVALASIQALHKKLEHLAGEPSGLSPTSAQPLLPPGTIPAAAWRLRAGSLAIGSGLLIGAALAVATSRARRLSVTSGSPSI